jgi:hypothetical protein
MHHSKCFGTVYNIWILARGITYVPQNKAMMTLHPPPWVVGVKFQVNMCGCIQPGGVLSAAGRKRTHQHSCLRMNMSAECYSEASAVTSGH